MLNKTNLSLKMCFSFGVNVVFMTKLVKSFTVLLNIYLIFIQVDPSTSTTQNPNPQDRKIHAVRIWIKIADSDTNNLPWGKEEDGLKFKKKSFLLCDMHLYIYNFNTIGSHLYIYNFNTIGSMSVFEKLWTYPSPNLTFILNCYHLTVNGLGEG